MFECHPPRSIGLVGCRAEPGGTAEADGAAQVKADHFERVIPAVTPEPAPELRRIEHALVPAHAFSAQVRLMTLEIAEPIEPGICAHP